MPTNVKVCINGFVLSTLLFDCTNNTGDQEGFLYGSITRNVRREISDQSMCNTQEDILISICSSVPFGSFLSFYNNVGEIKREDLDYNLGERVENIIGWYRFRRYSAMFPSTREQSIHRHLRALFARDNNVDQSQFVFGLLSSSNLTNFATHSYDYGFFIQKRDGTFRDLPFTILNLGDTRNSYRSGSMALPFMNSSSFNSVLSSSWNFTNFYETENQIHQFHQRLRMKLESLQEELAASDAVNASLEDDIRKVSNEMQTLLATQERLASTTAAREVEHAQASGNETNETEPTKTDANKESKNIEIEYHERTAIAGSESKIDEGKSTKVIEKKSTKYIETEASASDKMVTVNEIEIAESSNVELIVSPERETTESEDQDSSDSKEEPMLDRVSETTDPLDAIDDDSRDSRSSEDREMAVSSPCLKRVCSSPLTDNRSVKRVCLDKYFESGEYLDSAASSEIASSVNIDDSTSCNSKRLVVDPDNGEMSSAVKECDNVRSEILSDDIAENRVPSPASNVEIVISGGRLEGFESAITVDESVSSSDELSDNKESDVKEAVLSVQGPSCTSGIKRSLSDSAISRQTEIASGRCESAHAELLHHVTDSTLKDGEKLVFDTCSSPSKSSSLDEPSSKVNTPIIIYASKVPQNQSQVPSECAVEHCEQMDESTLRESSGDGPGTERNQSSCDQNEKEKKNVP